MLHPPFASIPSFTDRTIIVLGDMMLDRFIHGRVDRVSPEAPVPVLLVEQEGAMPGGAANVARNIAALGGKVILIGVIGADAAGQELLAMLESEPHISADLVQVPGMPTIQKIRYVADQQQLLRADVERPIPDSRKKLEHIFLRNLAKSHAVVISDYAKGTLTPKLLTQMIAAAREANIPVIVDPKNADLRRYDGATILTPNRREATTATSIAGEDDEETSAAATAILDKVPAVHAVLVTRGPRGMTLAQRWGGVSHSPARAREVFDVSGAGDTVIATLALAIAAGCGLGEAVHMANTAAGIVVGKHGTATVTFEELEKSLRPARSLSDFKTASVTEAGAAAARWRAKGERVGFTNGCFDLIHPGHISLLSQARTECDHLIVGLNTDASVKRLKGTTRPIQDEVSRAIVLGSLAAVDLIVLFDEDTPLNLIKAIRPDVLIKGQDYTVDTVVGADIVQDYGGRVYLAEINPGQSTTNTIASMTRKIS